MKQTGKWLPMAACVLVMLVSLVFAAIAGWQLWAGDWRLFENDRLALIQSLAKLLLCLYCFGIGLRRARGRRPSGFWGGLGLIGISLAANPFLSNHLGLALVGIAVLFFLTEPQTRRVLFGRRQ